MRYWNIYPGVDLIYHGNQQQLDYDFVVSPGADSGRLALGFRGADSLELDTQGDLVLHSGLGDIHQRKPTVYQEVAGARREISGGYVLRDSHTVGFQVGAYDESRPLVIDPVLIYSSYFGGSSDDTGNGVAVDATGNAYVTGGTNSTDFPKTLGTVQTTAAGSGSSDVFVAKLNPAGSALIYSTYFGGSSDDIGLGIAVDTTGNAYVTGDTNSVDFPTTLGAFQTVAAGNYDAFVTKLNPTGSALVYSTHLGGSTIDYGNGIAVDATGHAYVTGDTNSTDFPTTRGAFQITAAGGFDAFVTKLNPAGSGLVYSTRLGGRSDDIGDGVAVDATGNAYVTGGTNSTDFPTSRGAFQVTAAGGSDAFVTKLNPTGSAVVYSTHLGGSSIDFGDAIAVDATGNAYVTGATTSTDFPTTRGAFQTTAAGNEDAFVTKLDPTGSTLVYSIHLGGGSVDFGNAIAVDATGNAYVTGGTNSTNFPTTPGAFQRTFAGSTDAFVTKLNPSGSALVYSTYLGGSYDDIGKGIAVDAAGSAYVTGDTNSSNFRTTPGASQTTVAGSTDAFVAKISGPI